MNPLAAAQCANAGCVVVVFPLPLDVAAKPCKIGKKDWIIDTRLGQATGCMVIGSKESCDKARKALGLDVEAKNTNE